MIKRTMHNSGHMRIVFNFSTNVNHYPWTPIALYPNAHKFTSGTPCAFPQVKKHEEFRMHTFHVTWFATESCDNNMADIH
jgi:hypothetical protein